MPLTKYRALLAQVLQYSLLARLSEITNLRACDISEDEIDGRPALAVVFRGGKTDPSHQGETSFLVKVDGPLCPYTLTKLYMKSNGFVSGDSETITDASYLFARTQGGTKYR